MFAPHQMQIHRNAPRSCLLLIIATPEKGALYFACQDRKAKRSLAKRHEDHRQETKYHRDRLPTRNRNREEIKITNKEWTQNNSRKRMAFVNTLAYEIRIFPDGFCWSNVETFHCGTLHVLRYHTVVALTQITWLDRQPSVQNTLAN